MSEPLSHTSARADLLRCWRRLSKPMKRAMDEAANKPLRKSNAGWSSKGFDGHAQNTIEALVRKGLVRIVSGRKTGTGATAELTPLGIAVFCSIGEPVDGGHDD